MGDRELPDTYDARLEGRVPPVRDQGSLGTCWAFASLTALESSLLPEEQLEFSADHMTLHNSFSLSQDAGGEYSMAMAYLLAWQGPVLESQDPYGDGISPDGLTPYKHVQEIQILPEKDYTAIKRAVYLTGGVQSSLYTDMTEVQKDSRFYNRETNAYCYLGEEKPNHDSVIIGWDDHFPKERFQMEPERDGAFLCTNSWGEGFGDQGYFYVSYEDSNIGVHNIVYTGVEPVDNYDRICQTDLCGWMGQIGYGEETVWFANAYESYGGEELMAAGFYATMENTSYELYVARHLERDGMEALNAPIFAGSGRMEYSGFYTVPLEKKVDLDEGEKFAVMVKITTPGAVHPAAIEYDGGEGVAQVDLSDGEGYLSRDGRRWEQVEKTMGCNLCLKAYLDQE
ncbi:MAG: peptidase C1 [Lachnospiraceae bacterium]|nr:peptidase C1 [Lachnospiraceae bacterium]